METFNSVTLFLKEVQSFWPIGSQRFAQDENGTLNFHCSTNVINVDLAKMNLIDVLSSIPTILLDLGVNCYQLRVLTLLLAAISNCNPSISSHPPLQIKSSFPQ